MTRYEIARILGWPNPPKESDLLDRVESIAKRAALAEREACAKACDSEAEKYTWYSEDGDLSSIARLCAEAIRARGQE